MPFGIIEFGVIIVGFALLVWGADRFVMGAAGTAQTLGVSTLIIGLVVVGFGTSAPEMLVGAIAAFEGNPGIAVGNAIGSNITNIGLVIGVTALIVPLAVNSDVLKREFPMLIVIMGLALLLFLDGELSRLDGILLLLGLFLFIAIMVRIAMRGRKEHDPMTAEFEAEIPHDIPLHKSLLWLLFGLIILLVAARMVVWGAVEIAQHFGVSDLVIGLTIVAIGTSLPELAASIMSARKGEHDIAIGNAIGSNMFNMLGVMGIPAVIQPFSFESSVLTRDFPAMFLLTILLFFMARKFNGGGGEVTRAEGIGLLVCYFAYMGVLFFMS
ncbi:MAG: calcium/sodium antiporter [Gammaproteobacteria bacterium]|nr:calcium/sodium antiporter [Gammaproteobacteria bacterium]MDH5728566.1 calcium/sodium antiporter [Gammaproteobacteria bacterium]